MPVFAAIAALIGGAFGLAVLNQYRTRRKPYQLVWGAALLMFGIAALCEAIGLAAGWSAGDYKAYYLFGALLNVGWLAVGELYLLTPGRPATIGAVLMGLLTVVSVAAVLAAGTYPDRLQAQFPEKASTVPGVLPAVINSVGTVILVLGPLWSAWRAYRRTAPWGLVAGTALIAIGAFVVGGAHSIAVLFSLPAVRPVSEAIGIAVMFGGYLVLEAERPVLKTRAA